MEVSRRTRVPLALYSPAGEVSGVTVGEGLLEGELLGEDVGEAVTDGLGLELGLFDWFWLNITNATIIIAIKAITPTTASFLFRFRDLTAEGLTLRFVRELMRTNTAKLYLNISI
jgi:hypothetical protein